MEEQTPQHPPQLKTDEAVPPPLNPTAPPPASTELSPIYPPDVRIPMHGLTCPDCHIPFSLPFAMYAERLGDKGQIYCPAGHPIQLQKSIATTGDVFARSLILLGQLSRANEVCQRLRNELSRRPAPPSETIDKKELNRRIQLLHSQAERVEYGKCICRFCGKRIAGNYNFRQHLKRNHGPDITELASTYFD